MTELKIEIVKHTKKRILTTRMKISGIKHKETGEVIFSRARHDFHWDSTRTIAIDGGTDYTRIVGDLNAFQHVTITLEGVTAKDLYDDWNTRTDKYGCMSKEYIQENNIQIEEDV